MSISLFFTAWNLDPVRTWLSPRKLGIVRISAESFTAADTFYESSHFPKPNSCALKKTCRNISASSKCTADQYYQFLVLRNDRNWYFENRPLSLGRPDTRRWNYTIETSRLISFFRLVVLYSEWPLFSICSKLSVKSKYLWNRRLAQIYILESNTFTISGFKSIKVSLQCTCIFSSMVRMQVDCGY